MKGAAFFSLFLLCAFSAPGQHAGSRARAEIGNLLRDGYHGARSGRGGQPGNGPAHGGQSRLPPRRQAHGGGSLAYDGPLRLIV